MAKAQSPTRLDNLTEDLKNYSLWNAQLTALQGEIDDAVVHCIDEFRPEFVELQEKIGALEFKLEVSARQNPQWFEKKKTVSTPFGSVKFHLSSKLEVENEELTLALIEVEATKADGIRAGHCVKQIKALDIEQLEKLDDQTLMALRVRRVKSDNFKVIPKTVDLESAMKPKEEVAK